MRKYSIITVLLLFSLIFTVSTSQALPDFNVTNSNQIYATASCGLGTTDPYDPKVACESDGDSCVAIFYDNSLLCSQGLKYSVSRDGFDTIEYHGIVYSTSFGKTTFLDPMTSRGSELPYDIVWDDNTNMYYIVIGTKIYVIPAYNPGVGDVTPYRITDGFALAGGGTAGADLSIDCCTETGYKSGEGYSCSGALVYGVKFDSNNATRLFGTYQARPHDSSPTDYDAYYAWFDYDVTNTSTDQYDCTELYTDPSCSGAGSLAIDYYSAYAEYSDDGAWKYNIETQVDYCDGAGDVVDVVHDFDTLSSPNDDYNHFYFGGNLYYRNETEYYVLSSESSDLSSFNSPETAYQEDYTGIEEIINQSDADDGGDSNYYIFLRSSNLTDGTDGIYVQAQETYPIIVSSNKDVFVSLYCSSEDYTTTGSGKIFQIYTPCQTGNQLTFISDYSPQSDIQTLDFDGCDVISYEVHYPENPYDYFITVKDALTNGNLEGVSIDLTGEDTETTDSGGKATFNINAITSPDFDVEQDDCGITLSTTGTPKTIYGSAELSGYTDKDFSFTPGELTEGTPNTWSFETNRLLTMNPEGVIINAIVYTLDGYEVETDSYNISVTGNNNLTYTFIDGKQTLRNWNRNVPSSFLLYDNRSSYTVTVDLTYPGGSDTQDLDVDVNEEYDAYFYLPNTFLDLPCLDSGDCVNDFCDESGYHHSLSGCYDNECQYKTTDCQTPSLCDDAVGCFQGDTEKSCTTDNQCLYNSSVTYCIDDYSMYTGFCGSDGKCKKVETECSTFCNETVGYCNEKANCLLSTSTEVGFEWSGGSSITDLKCNFDNSPTSVCLKYGEITDAELSQEGKTINDVSFTHDGFTYTRTNTGYDIGDVVVSCSEDCEDTITFCNSGVCSVETGKCLNPGSQDNGIGALIWGAWLYISGLVPIELRIVAWLFFTIGTMIYYKQETGKHGSNNDQSTLIVGFIMLIAGFGIGWLHWVLLVILGMGVAIVMWQKLGQ